MIVFGTRGSELALTQTTQVAESVRAATGEDFRLEIIRTRGDEIIDKPLPEVGGKGLFTAELEAALRDGRIDVAIHSLKDLPVEDPAGLTLGAVPARAPVHDVLVYDPAHDDPEGGTLPLGDRLRVGTSSPRRAAALATLRKDLTIADVRGNVPTRADKVRRGDYAAVVLAAAGIARLGLDLDGLARVELPTDRFVPAPGQGALGVQCRRDDGRVRALLQTIHDETTARCVHAERRILAGLEGGCSTPLGALVQPDAGGGFTLTAALFTRSGAPTHRVLHTATGPDPDALATAAVDALRPLADEPLAGRDIVLVRPGGGDSELAAWLAVAGAQVDSVALTEALPVAPDAGALAALWAAPVLVLTSARGVDRLFEEAATAGVELRERTVYAVGPRTAEALRARGCQPRMPSAPLGGARLAELIHADAAGRTLQIGFACAQDRSPELERTLAAAGHSVHAVPLYRIAELAGVAWPRRRYDAAVWTSPSSVRSAARLADPPDIAAHVAIGTTTAAALGDRALAATAPTPAAVLDATRRAVHDRTPRGRVEPS